MANHSAPLYATDVRSIRSARGVSTLLLFTLLALTFTERLFAGVDPELPAYQRTSGVSGILSSVGSDTLANLMAMWSETYRRFHPNVDVQVQAAGSATAPPALINGGANLGPMSRLMKSQEIQAFERQYGYRPTPVSVAIDAISIYVHKDNPLENISLREVDAIFSLARKCGDRRGITQWGQLGIPGTLGTRDIQLFGRNSVSGTYGYFKSRALCRGDFKPEVNEQPGSAAVVQAVSESLNGIGYSGMGYRTASVRALPLGKRRRGPFYEPSEENALSGRYPLARFLYLYVNKHPNRPLAQSDPVAAAFVRMVLSQEGQEVVQRDGFVPLPAPMAARSLKSIK